MEPMKKNKQVKQHHVDTSRPFTSVKEAVATFGQRIMLPGKIHALNSKPVSPIASPSTSQTAKPVNTSIGQIARPNKNETLIVLSYKGIACNPRDATGRDRKGTNGSGPKGYEGIGTKRVRIVQDQKGTNGVGQKGCERFGTKRVQTVRDCKSVNVPSPKRGECNITERVRI
uniref:Uncharacterized protein n=1 Tax=Brassica oleracea var. oleracea TaxID=109376 RepID=A0A0D3BUY3_BRAOL